MIKLTMTSGRQLVGLETEEFSLKFNGRTNAEYRTVLKQFGIELQIVNGDGDALMAVGIKADDSLANKETNNDDDK